MTTHPCTKKSYTNGTLRVPTSLLSLPPTTPETLSNATPPSPRTSLPNRVRAVRKASKFPKLRRRPDPETQSPGAGYIEEFLSRQQQQSHFGAALHKVIRGFTHMGLENLTQFGPAEAEFYNVRVANPGRIFFPFRKLSVGPAGRRARYERCLEEEGKTKKKRDVGVESKGTPVVVKKTMKKNTLGTNPEAQQQQQQRQPQQHQQQPQSMEIQIDPPELLQHLEQLLSNDTLPQNELPTSNPRENILRLAALNILTQWSEHRLLSYSTLPAHPIHPPQQTPRTAAAPKRSTIEKKNTPAPTYTTLRDIQAPARLLLLWPLLLFFQITCFAGSYLLVSRMVWEGVATE